MAVYKNSRYATKLNIYHDRKQDVTYMDFPKTSIPPSDSDFVYQLRGGETLEFLANQFYGDPQLKWVILFANPQYTSELDAKIGDLIVIPERGRVNDIVNDA